LLGAALQLEEKNPKPECDVSEKKRESVKLEDDGEAAAEAPPKRVYREDRATAVDAV
jgi:hypothetical protein